MTPRSSTLLSSVAEAIGDTPLVELSRLTRGVEGRILAKLDYLNPGFSKKDRIARQIIEEAHQSGELTPGQTVVELTSGNTGTGAAIVCAVTGHPFVAVMSEGNSPERARMMRALGAEVVLVAQAAGSVPGQVSGDDLARVEARTQELTAKLGAYRVDQFVREGNSRAHELHTGPEIWEASGGAITAFCDFVGSGGTYAGLHRAFKARSATVRGYVVEPAGAAVLAGQAVRAPGHRIQGGGYSMPDLTLLGDVVPDGYLTVTDEQAMIAARRLASDEGIFGGFSAGANVAAALALLAGPERGGTIAVLICDSGLKYLSTDLWA
ncbi:MAG TPA: cysteine synthase family protein [Phenylobacterium sp.]|nr:cysteine synthase family protein [Phenylobacterium sp.]